jgi:hypothetical protein
VEFEVRIELALLFMAWQEVYLRILVSLTSGAVAIAQKMEHYHLDDPVADTTLYPVLSEVSTPLPSHEHTA